MHSQGPFAAYDHLSTYLTAIFNFLGILDVEVIRAEGIAYGTGAGSSRDGERCSEY
jgi:FMN-dependent NADH-azoreductase